MNRRILLLLFCVCAVGCFSQSFMRPNEWKKYRREVYATLGSSHFLGDLGGRNGKGTDYSPADLDFNQTRTAFAAGVRYKLERTINVSAKISNLLLKGDDAATQDIYRHNRNLNFKSNVWELSVRGEYGWQSKKRGGNRYGIMQNYGKQKNFAHAIYGFLGVGVFYFNPKGLGPDGKWVKLRPLHTEGQGLPGGPKQYKNIAVCIPVGAYYKLTLNKVWCFGVEVGYRKTFTDYIDDVGSVYYDNQALADAYGPLAARMADPNLGEIYGATRPSADGTPAQRGDRQKDTYVSFELTAGFIFKQQRRSARLRSKF
jgi:hypothetical protein